MKLLKERLIVKPASKESKTAGGIIVEASREDQFKRGTVVNVSDEIKDSISLEDTVVFGRHAGVEIFIDNQPHLVLYLEDVIGVE